jgi:RimJ/RimL family protein N-acetyltransferase
MMTLPTDNEIRRTTQSGRLPGTDRPGVTSSDWRDGLPILLGAKVTLRDLRISDAPSLHRLLTTEEVARFITPPPTTVAGFERFIQWADLQRMTGRYACFAVVPHGMDTAIGLFQVRQLDADFATAEWGFALGSAFWGTGIFPDAASLAIEFAFDVIGVRRLEARAVIENQRGNGALKKIGAVCEGILRGSFMRGSKSYDQALWAILKPEWRRTKAVWVEARWVH